MLMKQDKSNSLKRLQAPQILENICDLAEKGHDSLEEITGLYNELKRRKNSKWMRKARVELRKYDLSPIYWLDRINKITNSFEKKTTGKNHVYIVLLDNCNRYRRQTDKTKKFPRYGIYIGQTSKKPENRLKQHKEGKRLFARCWKRMLFLLPSLYEHLNPLSTKEAKEIESELAKVIRSLDMIRVEGGH